MPNDSTTAKMTAKNVIDPAVLARAAARDAEVNGKPARIEPLAEDQFTEEMQVINVEMKKAAGIPQNGYMPEFFAIMLRHPKLFRAHSDLAMVLMGTPTLPLRDRELAVLRIGWLCQAPYEWNAHVDMAKRMTDLTAEEIERTIIGSTAPGWREQDAVVLRAVEELLADAMITDATWAKLASYYDEPQLLEFPILVGQYLGVAYLQNSIRARLMPGNVGLSAR
jgi:4-carboxymuconolactone decarboxylase